MRLHIAYHRNHDLSPLVSMVRERDVREDGERTSAVFHIYGLLMTMLTQIDKSSGRPTSISENEPCRWTFVAIAWPRFPYASYYRMRNNYHLDLARRIEYNLDMSIGCHCRGWCQSTSLMDECPERGRQAKKVSRLYIYRRPIPRPLANGGFPLVMIATCQTRGCASYPRKV